MTVGELLNKMTLIGSNKIVLVDLDVEENTRIAEYNVHVSNHGWLSQAEFKDFEQREVFGIHVTEKQIRISML